MADHPGTLEASVVEGVGYAVGEKGSSSNVQINNYFRRNAVPEPAARSIKAFVICDSDCVFECGSKLGKMLPNDNDLSVFLKRGWHRFAPSKRVGVGRANGPTPKLYHITKSDGS